MSSTELRGQCNYVTKIIHIRALGSPCEIAVTFLHEIMHGLELTLNKLNIKMDYEDRVNFHSPLLVAFWRDNPAVFKWWVGLVNGEGE